MNGTATSLSNSIADVLQDIGVPANHHGYGYLFTAIELVYNSDNHLSATRVVYPYVAEKHGTTPVRVERCIRHSVETAWDRGDIDVLYSFFGNTVSSLKGKTTNMEFVYKIADTLKRKGYARTAPTRR